MLVAAAHELLGSDQLDEPVLLSADVSAEISALLAAVPAIPHSQAALPDVISLVRLRFHSSRHIHHTCCSGYPFALTKSGILEKRRQALWLALIPQFNSRGQLWAWTRTELPFVTDIWIPDSNGNAPAKKAKFTFGAGGGFTAANNADLAFLHLNKAGLLFFPTSEPKQLAIFTRDVDHVSPRSEWGMFLLSIKGGPVGVHTGTTADRRRCLSAHVSTTLMHLAEASEAELAALPVPEQALAAASYSALKTKISTQAAATAYRRTHVLSNTELLCFAHRWTVDFDAFEPAIVGLDITQIATAGSALMDFLLGYAATPATAQCQDWLGFSFEELSQADADRITKHQTEHQQQLQYSAVCRAPVGSTRQHIVAALTTLRAKIDELNGGKNKFPLLQPRVLYIEHRSGRRIVRVHVADAAQLLMILQLTNSAKRSDRIEFSEEVEGKLTLEPSDQSCLGTIPGWTSCMDLQRMLVTVEAALLAKRSYAAHIDCTASTAAHPPTTPSTTASDQRPGRKLSRNGRQDDKIARRRHNE